MFRGPIFQFLAVIAWIQGKKHLPRCAGLAFVAILAGVPACAQSTPNPVSSTPIPEAAQIRATGNKLIARGVSEDVIKGAALLEKADQLEQAQLNAEKLALEKEKLRLDLAASQGGHWKDLVATFIPLATTIILAGTFIWQMVTARRERWDKQRDAEKEDVRKAEERAEQRKRDAEEASQKERQRFTDALRDLWRAEKISVASALLGSFREEPYRTWAMDTAVNMLLSRETIDEFTTLYMDVLNPITYEQLPRIAKLCGSVDASYDHIAEPVWNEKTRRYEVERLSPEHRAQFDLYLNEQGFLSQKLAALLRTPVPAGVSVDLSNLVLRDIDLSGLDLGAANISGARWSFIRIDDCDMSGIVEFNGCRTSLTAWWHASRIRRPLLEHLKKNFPFSQGSEYNTKHPVSVAEYTACVAKLDAGGSETGGSRAPGMASPAMREASPA